MNRTDSDPLEFAANELIDADDGIVSATVVEDATFIKRILDERDHDACDRCSDPRRLIAGVVFFRPTSTDMMARLVSSEWALCADCLDALKRRGYQPPGRQRHRRN